MRIKEIIESELVNPEIKKHGWEPSQHTRDQVSHAGAFSYLDPDFDDDHEVLMKNFKSMGTDLKMEFYKSMAPLMGANPYMPVVYNINQFMDPSTQSRNEFQMERLVPVDKLDSVRLYQALNLVVHHIDDAVEGSAMNHVYKNLKEYESNPEASNAHGILMDVHDALTNGIIEELAEKIESGTQVDSPLKEFLSDLSSFAGEMDANVDMHDENFLYRRTSHGAQMVIADPIDSEPLP